MPRFAAALQDEIRRLARKEVRSLTGVTRRAATQHRRDIADLKRQVTTLTKLVKTLDALERKRVPAQAALESAVEKARFSPKWIKSRREKLSLSAESYAKLIGVSGLSVYNWELGKSVPRKDALAKLVAVKSIGRREALRRLENLNGALRKNGARSLKRRKRRKARHSRGKASADGRRGRDPATVD